MNRIKTWLPLSVTLLFYAGVVVWLILNQEQLSDLVWMPWPYLAGLLGISLFLNLLIYPFRYRLLLSGAGVRLRFLEAIRDRHLYLAVKRVAPFFLTDPIGFYLMVRRWKISRMRMLTLWSVNKVLTVLALAILLAVALAQMLSESLIAGLGAGGGLVLVLAFMGMAAGSGRHGASDGTNAGFAQVLRSFDFSFQTRFGLIVLSVVAEALEVLAMGIALAGVLPSGFGPLTLVRLVGIQFLSSIPVTLWGAGTREGVSLLFFHEYAPEVSLIMAAFSVFLIVGLLPALIGMVFLGSYMREDAAAVERAS